MSKYQKFWKIVQYDTQTGGRLWNIKTALRKIHAEKCCRSRAFNKAEHEKTARVIPRRLIFTKNKYFY